jgi:hypothetical protein
MADQYTPARLQTQRVKPHVYALAGRILLAQSQGQHHNCCILT